MTFGNAVKSRRAVPAAVLVLVLALCLASPGDAENPARVTVVNTSDQPIPTALQGTAAISGSVAINAMPPVALAPGTAVGIAGTASVNVANQPTVDLAGGAMVGVDPLRNLVRIDAASPVPVREAGPAREIVRVEVGPGNYIVPPSRTLVIEHVSVEMARAEEVPGHILPALVIEDIPFPIAVIPYVTYEVNDDGSRGRAFVNYVGSQQVRLVARAGELLRFQVCSGSCSLSGRNSITLAGYLIEAE